MITQRKVNGIAKNVTIVTSKDIFVLYFLNQPIKGFIFGKKIANTLWLQNTLLRVWHNLLNKIDLNRNQKDLKSIRLYEQNSLPTCVMHRTF